MSKNKIVPINLNSLSSIHSDKISLVGPRGIIRNPKQVICGDSGIRINVNGEWYHQGSPIKRMNLVKLFASILQRDDNGEYWLITPAEMARIEVEDAPFLAVELIRSGKGPRQILSLRTNLDQIVTVDDNHPIRIDINHKTGEPAPYVILEGSIEAKITRAIYYDLVSISEKEDKGSQKLGVWSKKIFFPLGSLESDL
jgi:hypothetical protein